MSKLRPFLLLIVLVLPLAAIYFGFAQKRKPNVIFVLCDTLRPDHLGVYGYNRPTSPQIDRFAAQSLVFSNAVSAAPWTPPSMASIFTGVIPSVHGLNPPNNRESAKKLSMRLSDQFTTLAEHFQQAGYATYGVSASPWTEEAFGLRQGFDQTKMAMRSSADRINQLAFEALDQLSASDKPFLLYLHYMDVHKRGDNPSAPYQQFKAEKLERWDYPPQILEEIAKYDAELNFFDTHFGALLERLRAKDLFDHSIIVFTADHGEQFKERGKLGHGFSLHSEELRVPLIVKIDQLQGRRDDLVSSRDIMATLVKFALPKNVLGDDQVSLLDRTALSQRAGLISEGSRLETLKGITFADHKRLVLRFAQVVPTDSIDSLKEGQIFEAFDPVLDPRELTKIEDSTWLEEARSIFEENFQIALKTRVKSEHTEISEESLKELESLGYLGG